MADGYSRVSGRHGVCIAQNGPGITNFVTAIAAAYWAHSPVVAITPETGSMALGLGGFQETDQLPIFSKITKYQAPREQPRPHGRDRRRAASTARCSRWARRSSTSRATISTASSSSEIPRPLRDRARRRRRSEPRRGGGAARRGEVPGDHRRRRRHPVERRGSVRRARRRCSTRRSQLELPAQRFVPGEPPALVRTARLPRLEGGDEAHLAGRRGARARHAPRTVRHAAAVRLRLLAEEREAHPGRRRRRRCSAW